MMGGGGGNYGTKFSVGGVPTYSLVPTHRGAFDILSQKFESKVAQEFYCRGQKLIKNYHDIMQCGV